MEIVVATESSLHVGATACDEPSLKNAVAEYCVVLFSFTELAPLMASDVSVGGLGLLMTITY
ncbi:MAG: hypothetical protein HBSAPP01_27150 [Candidatus Brocadia sapporoensis]|nr:MAG: hypothetical protein HBSAPP01_27150 [Candidatus Brocadia sapporoensis]